MPALHYAVTATIHDPEIAREYTRWLLEGHTDAVLRGGATAASVVRLDGDGPARIETRYRFPSRDAFAAYEAGPAVALREEGRARFAGRGVEFERRVGEVLAEQGTARGG
jgi:hypothetical protein